MADIQTGLSLFFFFFFSSLFRRRVVGGPSANTKKDISAPPFKEFSKTACALQFPACEGKGLRRQAPPPVAIHNPHLNPPSTSRRRWSQTCVVPSDGTFLDGPHRSESVGDEGVASLDDESERGWAQPTAPNEERLMSRLLPPHPPESAPRRRLPPTPVIPIPQPTRRASSPRMLPTPPPTTSPTMPSATIVSPSPSPPTSSASFYLERRPSTGRRLPPEPTPPEVILSTTISPSLHLQRSASARSPVGNRAAQLPPTAPRPVPNVSMSRLAPDDKSATASAPQSPRGSRNSVGDLQIGSARKFSTDIGRDSLSRNGSMAHLLEQQHLLRREFTATPDSVAHSATSSLSPSIEQLNCVPSSKSSSDGDDPNCHGLDPTLYSAQTPVNSTSIPDIVSTTNTVPSDIAEPRPKGLGLIYCTLQHFPVRKRIRVSVLKIEGLAGELRPELEMQPFCKVNVLPAKASKQQSGVVKRGRNVVFNQEFFFDGIATEDLDSRSLFIEVCHQSSQKLQRDLEIGEISVPFKDLAQLSTKKEVRIIEELKHRPNVKKLGKLHITTCVDKEARLTINIIKVDDLPKWGIIGAPDVCVRITLAQGDKSPQTKSSRVLKSTCSAVYKEAVMFLLNSTKKSDLQNLKVTISVHDMLRSVTGDDVIGSVYLGQLAVDKSETEQWKNTIEHIGKEYKGSHHLKSSTNPPDVHVSETHSDDEYMN